MDNIGSSFDLPWIILEARGGDKPELSEEEYIKFVLSHIVTSPSLGIINGFVMSNGDVIGYTSESSGNIHYILACIYLKRETLNPLLTLDNEFSSIKIKSEKSFKLDNQVLPTKPQVTSWLKVLEMTGEKTFNLGWGYDTWFTLGQIVQMDTYTLNKHLTT